MQVSDHVRAVQVPEDEPMRPGSTNIYLVGRGQTLSIDSGEAIDKFRWMIRGYLAAIEQTEIGIAAVTHHHYDHSGNLKDLRAQMGADIAVPESGVSLLKGRLPQDGVQTLTDGATIDLDDIQVQVLATPGHSVDSLCYYIESDGVLFTGDTLLGTGTTTVGDLDDYRRSLQRLVELPNLRILCPGHGPLVHDARERLQTYIDHRRMREDQILTALRGGGPRSSWEIMLELYPDIDTRLRAAADGNVRAHLEQLRGEGRIRVTPGRKRKPSPLRAARRKAQDRDRRAVIRKAKSYEAAQRKDDLRRQENPPTDTWAKQPTYHLDE